jgi:hypothetical protein
MAKPEAGFWVTKRGAGAVFLAAFFALAALSYSDSPFGPLPVHAAVITVNTEASSFTDSGCSLNEAILSANADDDVGDCLGSGLYGVDTIVFADGVNLINVTSDLVAIQDDLTINGGGDVTVDGGDFILFTIFDANVTFNGLTITNGVGGSGGGISNQGSGALTVINSKVSSSEAALADGGGIFDGSLATLTLTGAQVRDNQAAGSGGGVYKAGGSAVITSSVIDGNLALGEGLAPGIGGGGIYIAGGSLTLIGSEVTDNTAEADLIDFGIGVGGGGIYARDSVVEITRSLIDGNEFLFDPTLVEMRAAAVYVPGFGGGGVYAAYDDTLLAMTLTITETTISDNLAEYSDGGGLYVGSGAVLSLIRSTVSGNDATVFEELPGGEEAGGYGGGLYIVGQALLENSTVSGNFAEDAGGGIYFHSLAQVELEFVTVNQNAAPEGSNIASGNFDASTISYRATIVANGEGGENCEYDPTTLASSLGWNIEDDDTCGFGPGDLENRNPRLRPLADNGGPTETHALEANSPAIDFVFSEACPAPFIDQRNEPRPVDMDGDGVGECDTGAYELQASVVSVATPSPTPSPTPTRTPTPTATPGRPNLGGIFGPLIGGAGGRPLPAATVAPLATVQPPRTGDGGLAGEAR